MVIADLHIHSRYSRATSRDAVPELLELWARRKGIGLVGTGDFPHPAWRAELAEKLVPNGEGLYTLREGLRRPSGVTGDQQVPHFVISGEISSIYKKDGRVRKVHNLILLPGLEAAETLSRRLEAIGNLHSDGRPILGLDSRDLLEITLESCPDAVFIPAHIWTPHFSLFGAFSGFDTIEACFGDLTPYIHALETGLSSDPPMNWRVSALDGYTLVSNSDAHSPAKLGREANLLDIPFSYAAMADAIQGRTPERFGGTIEFFPEEGKYHYDGHRNCHLCLKPSEAEKYDGKCPVCGKKLTIGVEHRVEQLADRAEGAVRNGAKPFESLVPLPETIAASTGLSVSSKRVDAQYLSMLETLGDEFSILRQMPVERIEQAAGPCIAEGIRRFREGRVERIPGYDGEYGIIRLLSPSEIESLNGQTSLFVVRPVEKEVSGKPLPDHPAPAASEQQASVKPDMLPAGSLNPEQQEAVEAVEPAVAVIAGPGTGKTKTLVERIAFLIEQRRVKPSQITAVTFTNKAAAEMRQRLEVRLGGKRAVQGLTVGTFHAICLERLSQQGPVRLVDESEAIELAQTVLRELGLSKKKNAPRMLLSELSRRKNGLPEEHSAIPEEAFACYQERLQRSGCLDFDDLLLKEQELQASAGKTKGKSDPFAYLLVDEFQDINRIQYDLICAWSRGSKSLFVIGDPDQSIYGFRGADAGCFDRLLSDRPGLRRIRLVKNYRSTPEILDSALPVISANPGEARVLEAQRPAGAAVRVVTAPSELSEGIFLAKEINRMVGGVDMLDAQGGAAVSREHPRGFSEIAVLYRTHRQSELLEACLKKEGIPYVVAGREPFLSDRTVRGVIDFFRFLEGGWDRPALEGCLRRLWDCPPDLAEQVSLAVGRMAEAGSGRMTAGHLEQVAAGFDGLPQLVPFFGAAQEWMPQLPKGKPWNLLDSFCAQLHPPKTGAAALEKLRRMAVFHRTMGDFLRVLTLGQESDLMRSPTGRIYDAGAVTLMTLHGAKGLEFPAVFLCGVRKGSIPLESERRPVDLEEERRLFYVGLTRAKEELILVCGKEPSPFLEQLPADRMQQETAKTFSHKPPDADQLRLF